MNNKKRLRTVAVVLALVGGLAAVSLLLGAVILGRNDLLFRGKPESEWIKNLKYRDDQQVEEWRTYGEEGVQVLVRGLEHAHRPGERAYRQLYSRLPGFLMRWVPAPKDDSTRAKRMELVSLLSSLGNDARSATSVMVRTLKNDEDDSVRQSAINFFNTSEDEKCLLNQLPAKEKKALLPAFIRAIQDTGNWGLRNNAAISLKWYPEEREIVSPVLVKAVQDQEASVRLLAAEALARVDPEAAKKAGALSVVIAISKSPDDQIASRAVAALKYFEGEPEPAVRALIEGLESTNSLVACQSVWSLEWASKEYKSYVAAVIPALQKAAERKDNVGKYAETALMRWKSESGTKQGAK